MRCSGKKDRSETLAPFQTMLVLLHPPHLHCELSELMNDGPLEHFHLTNLVFLFDQVCFICTFLNNETLTTKGGYAFPDWAYSLGWAIALSSVVPAPIYAGLRLCLAKGTLKEVIKKKCCTIISVHSFHLLIALV